jgi:hypothetical protein
MLKADQIRVGGFYVSESKGLVREVWDEKDGDVYWRAYVLRTGEPLGGGLVCSKYHLSRWADREATPEEIERMRVDQAVGKEMARGMEIANLVLQNMPDEMLLAEVRRRGLTVSDE